MIFITLIVLQKNNIKTKNIMKKKRNFEEYCMIGNSVKHFPILTFFPMIFYPFLWIFYIQLETSVLIPNFVHKHHIINPFSKLFQIFKIKV